jgi:hypothetical protein
MNFLAFNKWLIDGQLGDALRLREAGGVNHRGLVIGFGEGQRCCCKATQGESSNKRSYSNHWFLLETRLGTN